MYLYIIGFQTAKNLIVRTFLTDLDDIEILTAYYTDFLNMENVHIQRIIVDDTAIPNYNALLTTTLQQYEFKRGVKGFWLFKPDNVKSLVNSIVEYTNEFFEHFKKEDILRTKFSKFARETSMIIRKTTEAIHETQIVKEEEREAMPSLDLFYKDILPGAKAPLYFMAPSAVVANAPNGAIYAEVTETDEEFQQQPTKEGFGNIIVFENLLTNKVSYKIDNDYWTETLRNPKLADVFPECVVYASHLYRKEPHVEMLINAYLNFQSASLPNGNSEDIFLKLESIVGIDNLKRECAEGCAFGIPQEIYTTKTNKLEKELMGKYMKLLMGTTDKLSTSELLFEAVNFFMENYITKQPDGHISLVGLTSVLKQWLTKYLNTTAFGRFSQLLSCIKTTEITEKLSECFAQNEIFVDDNIITGYIFNDYIINLVNPGAGISSSELILRSMYFEYSILVASVDTRLPLELTEYLYTEIVKKFFNDAVEDKPDGVIPSRDLWGAFTRYLQLINGTNIIQRLGQTDFTPLCKSLGFEVKRSAAGMMWKRIALKSMFTNGHEVTSGTTPITTIMSTPAVAADTELVAHANGLLKAIGNPKHNTGKNFQLPANHSFPQMVVSPWKQFESKDELVGVFQAP